jgi:hypothetical protein
VESVAGQHGNISVPVSFEQEDAESLAIKVCTTKVAGFSVKSRLLIGSPENNLGPFLVRNGVCLSCLDYLTPISKKYPYSRKKDGCYAPTKSNSLTGKSPIRETYNEKSEGNDEQKALANKEMRPLIS